MNLIVTKVYFSIESTRLTTSFSPQRKMVIRKGRWWNDDFFFVHFTYFRSVQEREEDSRVICLHVCDVSVREEGGSLCVCLQRGDE